MSATANDVKVVTFSVSKSYEYGLAWASAPESFLEISSDSAESDRSQWFETATSLDVIDIDKDGNVDVLVGIPGCKQCFETDTSIGSTLKFAFEGSFYVVGLFSSSSGQISASNYAGGIKSSHKVGVNEVAGFYKLEIGDAFGYALKEYYDFDYDGKLNFIISSPGKNNKVGAIYAMSLTVTAVGITVDWMQEIQLGFTLPDKAFFGSALAILPDLNFDNVSEIAIGSSFKQSKGDNHGKGAVYILSLNVSRSDVCDYYLAYWNTDLSTDGVDCSNTGTGNMGLKTKVPLKPVPPIGVK